MKQYLISLALLFICFTSFAQSKGTLQQIAATPQNHISLPLDYAIIQPQLALEKWDNDYDYYYRFLTPKVKRAIESLSFKVDSVSLVIVPIAAKSHVELDTSTRIGDNQKIAGYWRTVINRKILFQDSVSIEAKKYFRNNTMLSQSDNDEVLYITDKKFYHYEKDKTDTKYKRSGTPGYSIESGRYLLLSGALGINPRVWLIGLDNEDRLILYAQSVEERITDNHVAYDAVIIQSIFERVNIVDKVNNNE